jgi:hypothetical protein
MLAQPLGRPLDSQLGTAGDVVHSVPVEPGSLVGADAFVAEMPWQRQLPSFDLGSLVALRGSGEGIVGALPGERSLSGPRRW